jgi:hypothetical protein
MTMGYNHKLSTLKKYRIFLSGIESMRKLVFFKIASLLFLLFLSPHLKYYFSHACKSHYFQNLWYFYITPCVSITYTLRLSTKSLRKRLNKPTMKYLQESRELVAK